MSTITTDNIPPHDEPVTYRAMQLRAMHTVALCTLIMDGVLNDSSFELVSGEDRLTLPCVCEHGYSVGYGDYNIMCRRPAWCMSQKEVLPIIADLSTYGNDRVYKYIKALKEAYTGQVRGQREGCAKR